MAWQPQYTTVEELAAFLHILDDQDDTQLGLAITSASRAIDTHCHRQFGQVDLAEERFYPMGVNYERGVYVARIDDIEDITDLVVELDGAVLTDYTLEPRNAPQTGQPYTRLVTSTRGTELAVTGLWGWSEVPEAVTEACLLQASRVFARRTTPFGIAGSPELGSELRLLSRLDADVPVILSGLVRPGSVG